MSREQRRSDRRCGAVLAAAGTLAGLVGLAVACVEPAGSDPVQDAQVALDADARASAEDALAEPDAALPDASPPPVPVQRDFCDAPFFQLPIGGPDEYVMGHSLWEDRLVYTRGGPRGVSQWDLYYLNLTDCLEYRLTEGFRGIDGYIRGNEILWTENREYRRTPDYYCMDIYSYDLATWTMRQLTDLPVCEWDPKTNGRHVVYSRSLTLQDNGPDETVLWDRLEGTETQLAGPGTMAGYYDINDRYVAWSAYTEYASSLGKDVFYLDLLTGEQTHVPNSANYYCYNVWLWRDHLTYICSEYWLQSWYHLFLHHIPTGAELDLDGADKDTRITGGAIHDGLVMWNTTKYMDTVVPFEERGDIEIYDIRTGVSRRLTTTQSLLVPWLVSFPYVFLIRKVAYHAYDYYIANLVSLGVTDATGFVIPGGPVIDPTQ